MNIEAMRTWKHAVDGSLKVKASGRKLFTVTRADDHPSTEPTYTFVPVLMIDHTSSLLYLDNYAFKGIQPEIQSFRKKSSESKLMNSAGESVDQILKRNERLLMNLENFDEVLVWPRR
jgi:hypothetical protein